MSNRKDLTALLLSLARIPAPSHDEGRRASFIASWLEAHGAEGVVIDRAKNVVFPYHPELPGPYDVVSAHTDVVFDDTSELPMRVDGDVLTGPGCGDDTANLTLLLAAIAGLLERRVVPKHPVLFVANACEEGFGNLDGIRCVLETYRGRVHSHTSFDCHWPDMVVQAVGSRRYELSCHTAGGHSYADFGRPNAVVGLARLIMVLAGQQLPSSGVNTWNVGTVTGGTTVNTIASDASCTYEVRSTEEENLARMERTLRAAVRGLEGKGCAYRIRTLGVRPTGRAAGPVQRRMYELCREVMAAEGGVADPSSASTDCNLPLSLGIPSLCMGLYEGAGSHTRGETVDLSSLERGERVAVRWLEALCAGRLDG